MKDIIIIGGGLGGLITSICLADKGYDVLVIEKKEYPFHKVCGEYISNEVKPFLSSIGLKIADLGPSEIKRLKVTSPLGAEVNMQLDLGGFGLSRYALDYALYTLAKSKGVSFVLKRQVEDVNFENDIFNVKLQDGSEYYSHIVVGSFGKRSNLDRQLNRRFFFKRSPYIGVKYHIRTEFPNDLIALHNFKDGYCGISKIEDNKYCLCYLSSKSNLKDHGNIEEMEKEVLFRNKHLKYIFEHSDFLYKKPEVINEISFERKEAVSNHLLFCGDAAGMISPLCGNGMAMAIHSSKILSELISTHFVKSSLNRQLLEDQYSQRWNELFSTRLFVGSQIQKLFGQDLMTEFSLRFLNTAKPVLRQLIKMTHGDPF
ncbi:MAG: FAD-dependent monooxygenase [Sporocytophaga sp.]|uniref:NAD(P)/FAD-dependent oxidoreductase n=1 Tax=Sporocytophaga sp. TaxID=2231183 RepID=UPI001B2BA8FB|nr:FAD-dependent monooxygenase [Sporocytophaga sp.]MBO9701485.1 FAD-dependent monooxygenase [Sporocytophaga sp.]